VSALSNRVCLGGANSFHDVLLIRSLLTVTEDSDMIEVSRIYYCPASLVNDRLFTILFLDVRSNNVRAEIRTRWLMRRRQVR
jgi:hypothetical protein